MDEGHGLELLARGGGLRRGHFQAADGHTDLRLDKYNGLIDPAGTRALGQALALRLADAGADAVIVWQDVEDLVLGFAVAAELGRSLVRAYNDDGLVGHAPELGYGRRAVLVTDQIRDPGAVRAVRALLETRGGALVRVGTLVAGESVDEVAPLSLLRVAPRVYPPADCPLCQQGVPLEATGRTGSTLYGIY